MSGLGQGDSKRAAEIRGKGRSTWNGELGICERCRVRRRDGHERMINAYHTDSKAKLPQRAV